MIALAACLVTALAASAAFAQTSGERDVFSFFGLKNVVSRPVQGSATDSGLTLRATSAYRDAYVLAVDMKVDGVGDRHVHLGPTPSRPNPSSGAEIWKGFTATLSSGQQLHPMGWSSRSGAEATVMATSDLSKLAGDELTLVAHAITLEQPHQVVQHGAEIYGGSGYEKTVTGTWTIKLHLPAVASGMKDLPAPSGEQINGLQINFHDIRSNGTYLLIKEDVSEVTPGALDRAFSWEDGNIATVPNPVWLAVYDSSGRDPGCTRSAATGPCPGPTPLDQGALKSAFERNDIPFNKGGPAPGHLSGTYHWTYMFIIPGPGTYKMVLHDNAHPGMNVNRGRQVGTLTIP